MNFLYGMDEFPINPRVVSIIFLFQNGIDEFAIKLWVVSMNGIGEFPINPRDFPIYFQNGISH